MQHTAYHIDRVFGTFKVFLQLSRDTIAVLHLHVIPGVHINFLNALPEDVLGQEGKFGHFSIKRVSELVLGHSRHCYPIILQVLGNVALDLLLSFTIAAICNESRILGGNVGLNLPQDCGKFTGI